MKDKYNGLAYLNHFLDKKEPHNPGERGHM